MPPNWISLPNAANLAELDSRARAALQAYLEKDNIYITCHREEMEGGDALPDTPAAFVAAMTLHSIALWHQDPYEEGSPAGAGLYDRPRQQR